MSAMPASIPCPTWLPGFVYSRSGLGAMQGLTVAQGVGVIDPDYRGEITVVLLNTSNEERRLRRGDRIAQLVFQPALQVELEECETLGATGSAPKTMPSATPMKLATRASRLQAELKAVMNISNMEYRLFREEGL